MEQKTRKQLIYISKLILFVLTSFIFLLKNNYTLAKYFGMKNELVDILYPIAQKLSIPLFILCFTNCMNGTNMLLHLQFCDKAVFYI